MVVSVWTQVAVLLVFGCCEVYTYLVVVSVWTQVVVWTVAVAVVGWSHQVAD